MADCEGFGGFLVNFTMGVRWRRIVLICMGAFCVCIPALSQAVDEEKVTHVKAAYLYSFLKFVTWPTDKFEQQDSPIVLGIMGDESLVMVDIIDMQARRRGFIQGRPISVISLNYVAPPDKHDDLDDQLKRQAFLDQVRGCHMLFVNKNSRKIQNDIFEIINEHFVLSVGRGDGFVQEGGMVSLVRKGESVVFQVNMDTVNRAKLTISPKLLRSAELIR